MVCNKSGHVGYGAFELINPFLQSFDYHLSLAVFADLLRFLKKEEGPEAPPKRFDLAPR